MPGDSLSGIGYWKRIDNRSTVFYGPDAIALLSEAFVRDHCFRVIGGTAEDAGAIGMAFEPVRARMRSNSPPEIRGTIWFDSATQQLRRLSFVWTRLPGEAPTKGLGGEILFDRVAEGPWHVARWHLRMPQDIVELQGSGDHVIRVQRLGIVEEGGAVLADSTGPTAGRATVSGVVRDANRRPLAGATVRVLGTPLSVMSDASGRYELGAIPAGLRTVVVDHPQVAPFGVRVGEARILLDDATTRTLSFRAPDASGLVDALCDRHPTEHRTTLRVTIVDSTTTAPIPGLLVRLSPVAVDGRSPASGLTGETDPTGAVVFCDAPVGIRLVLTETNGGEPMALFSLRRGEAIARTVRRVRRP
jgi:hypothetical protein